MGDIMLQSGDSFEYVVSQLQRTVTDAILAVRDRVELLVLRPGDIPKDLTLIYRKDNDLIDTVEYYYRRKGGSVYCFFTPIA